MKRDAAYASLPNDGDKEDDRQPKHFPPPEKTRSFWAENLPPNGLGHGITSACFNMPADGIVDDLKQIICEQLSHPRFYLTKRTFRLKLNGNHQPYYIKLNTIDNTAPLTFDIQSSKHFGRRSSSPRIQAVACYANLASCVCEPLLPRGHRFLQQPSTSADRSCESFEHVFVHSCRGHGATVRAVPTKLKTVVEAFRDA